MRCLIVKVWHVGATADAAMAAAEDEAMLELCLAVDTMFPANYEELSTDSAAVASESSQRTDPSCSVGSLPLVSK